MSAGGVSYNISVDTSSLNSQSGYLDFQFNPGGSSAESANASVTGFQSIGAILAAVAIDTGDASGSLPGTLTFDNGTAFNDVFQGITLGSSFSFDLTLSGPAIDSPGGTFGSAFAVSLYAADQVTPLLTTDPYGSVGTINVNAAGTTAAEVFPQSATNSTPAGTVTPEFSSATPEPSSLVICASTLPLGFFALHRGRRQKRGEARGVYINDKTNL